MKIASFYGYGTKKEGVRGVGDITAESGCEIILRVFE
jgi:hypothetical protein